MLKLFIKLIRDENGITGIEYALIVSLVSLSSFLSMQVVGAEVEETFNKISATIEQSKEEPAEQVDEVDEPDEIEEAEKIDEPDEYGFGCSRRK